MSLSIRSAAFAEGHAIPRRHTGDGEDLSPPLSWSTLPPRTTELALIVDDPDAPRDEPWVHWVIYKIPATASELTEGIPSVRAPTSQRRPFRGRIPGARSAIAAPRPPRGTGCIITTSSSTPSTRRSTCRQAWRSTI